MKLKLYSSNHIRLVILGLTLNFCQGNGDASKYAIREGEYPFLALLKVKSSSDGVQFENGCLVTLSWVLSLSCFLYKDTKSNRNSGVQVSVFAGLISMNDAESAPNRNVKRIVPDKFVSRGGNGPCLVLLQLESAFPDSTWLHPAPLNKGMISIKSHLVGWAWDDLEDENSVYAVSFKVVSLSGGKCYNEYGVAHYEWGMCVYETGNSYPLTVREGALLVDDEYLTGLMHEDTNALSPKYTSINVMVRLYWFVSWIQYCVMDNTLKTYFVETDNTEDDLFPLPRPTIPPNILVIIKAGIFCFMIPPLYLSKCVPESASLKVNTYLPYTLTLAILPLMQQWLSATML